jgi:hypothetical protein
MTHSVTGSIAAAEPSLRVRRAIVLVAMVGYPAFVAAWVGLPLLGVTGIAWGIAVGVLGLGVLLAALALYQFRRAMAQAPDTQLDERQVRVRDRAYLDAYRVYATVVMLVLLIGAILADGLDQPVALTFDLVQPLIWGAILYGMILPSAVVAWQEPDLPGEG